MIELSSDSTYTNLVLVLRIVFVLNKCTVEFKLFLLKQIKTTASRFLCVRFEKIQPKQGFIWPSLNRGTVLLAQATIAASAIQTKIYFTDLLTLFHYAVIYRNCSDCSNDHLLPKVSK